MASLPAARNARRRQDKEANTRMITFNKEKDIEELLRGIVKLSPEDFIALAKILDVKMSYVEPDTKKPTLRDAEEIINDIVAKFRKLKHKERKIVLKAVAKSGTTTWYSKKKEIHAEGLRTLRRFLRPRGVRAY